MNLVAEVALVARAAPAQLDGRGAQQVLDAAADRGSVRRHRAVRRASAPRRLSVDLNGLPPRFRRCRHSGPDRAAGLSWRGPGSGLGRFSTYSSAAANTRRRPDRTGGEERVSAASGPHAAPAVELPLGLFTIKAPTRTIEKSDFFLFYFIYFAPMKIVFLLF